MALTDFLTNGQIPEGSGLTALTKQTVLPDWYTIYAQQLVANQNAVSAQPYTTFQGPRVADFTPQQQQGFGMTGQAATAYQPGLTAATGATQGAVNAPGALEAAQPMINAAGQSSVANINQYMNPYNEQVVNRIGQLGARNLTENLLPQVEGRNRLCAQVGVDAQKLRRHGGVAEHLAHTVLAECAGLRRQVITLDNRDLQVHTRQLELPGQRLGTSPRVDTTGVGDDLDAP